VVGRFSYRQITQYIQCKRRSAKHKAWNEDIKIVYCSGKRVLRGVELKKREEAIAKVAEYRTCVWKRYTVELRNYGHAVCMGDK
jgi:hypothetical protein